MWGVCDQLCEDRTGSHHCSCREGYVLEQHRYCRAEVSGKCCFLSPTKKLCVLIRYSVRLCEHTVVLFLVLKAAMADLLSAFVWVTVK